MKKIALALVFLTATSVAACSSDKKPPTQQPSASSVVNTSSAVSTFENSDKALPCLAGAALEKLVQSSPAMAIKTAGDGLKALDTSSQDIKDNIKPYYQDVVDGKTSGSQYNDDLNKAKSFCGDNWKIPGLN